MDWTADNQVQNDAVESSVIDTQRQGGNPQLGGETPPYLPEDFFFLNPDGTPILLNMVGPDRVLRVYIATPEAGMPPALSNEASQQYLEERGINQTFGMVNVADAETVALTDTQRNTVQQIVESYARLTGLTVEYVTSPEDASLNIAPFNAPAYNPYSDGAPATTILPNADTIAAGVPPTVLLNMTELNEMGDLFELISTHEFGHAFGLRHPVDIFGTPLVQLRSTVMIGNESHFSDGTPRLYPTAENGARLGQHDVNAMLAIRQWVQQHYPNATIDQATAIHAGDDVWNMAEIMAQWTASPFVNIPLVDDGGLDALSGRHIGEVIDSRNNGTQIYAGSGKEAFLFGTAETLLGGGGDDIIITSATTEYVSADQAYVNGILQYVETATQQDQRDTLLINDVGGTLHVANDFEAIGMTPQILSQIQSVSMIGDQLVMSMTGGATVTIDANANIQERFFVYSGAETPTIHGAILLPDSEADIPQFMAAIQTLQQTTHSIASPETGPSHQFTFEDVSMSEVGAPQTGYYQRVTALAFDLP